MFRKIIFFFKSRTGIGDLNKIIQEIISKKTGLDQLTIEKKSSNILESDHNGKPIFEKPLEGDVKKSMADITLTKSKLNWNYDTELENGLKSFVN